MSETATNSNQFRELWLNPRRKRFWAIVFILLYTVCGFFLTPVLIKKVVVDLFQEDFGRTAQIEKIKVNPYVLSLEVLGFQVDDKDDVKLLAFDRFFANFQLSSLFKWAIVYKEVRLEAPYFLFERFKSGESRLQRFLVDVETAFPPDPDEPPKDQESSVPRLLIHDLSITNGRMLAKDNVPDRLVEIELAPVNIDVKELNTLPDIFGQQTVDIKLPNEGRLTWSGNIGLEPLHSEGELTLKNLRFDRSIAYLETMLPLEAVGGVISTHFKYRLSLDDQLGFTVQVDDLQTEVDDIVVVGLSPSAEFINIPKISLSGGTMRYPQSTLRFESLQIQQPVMSVWRNPDGTISLLDLVQSSTDNAPASDSAAAETPWSLAIGNLGIEGGQLNIDDNSIEPVAAINLADLNLKVTGLSNADATSMPLELTGNLQQGGSFAVNADVIVFPDVSVIANVTTSQIPLVLGQTYVKEFARIEVRDGALDSNLKMELPDLDSFSTTGSLQITALEVHDTLANQKLIGWKLLDIDQLEFKAGNLRFSQLAFEQPYGRMVINEDRSTNVSGLLIEPAANSAAGSSAVGDSAAGSSVTGDSTTGDSATSDASTQTSDQPMVLVIGGITVDKGAMDFADLSLPLPFSTQIVNLEGTISTIATNSATPANIKLEGQVNEYGLARIGGSLNMFDPLKHADVKVNFRNLLMSSLSPYTVEFAGREIAEGKLDLNLEYKIKEGLMDGQNDIVLSDLVLGEKVDHPGAASLPLGLAVALLKDSDGVIQVDLPVQGDINDPEFKIGGVVWKAIANLITKMVTAPFRFLGSLIGVDSEDLGQFEFLAGRSDLTPPELEKVVQLQQALQQRPELEIEISGVTDREIDIPALKYIQLRQAASERIGEGLDAEDQQSLMLDERIRAVVEEMFKERFPDMPTEELQAKHKVPPVDDPEGQPKLDELTYATDLWQQMLVAEVITDEDLEGLATARAEAIKAAFLASGEFDEKRVVIADSKQVTSEDGDWVVLELGVAAD